MNARKAGFVIVGGGIGGLAAALELARRGAESVTVLEKAPMFGEVGAGLQLAPNASRVLDGLGVLDELASDAFFPNRLVLRDAIDGDEIAALRTGEQFVARYGYPYMVTHRVDLHRALLEACQRTENVTLVPNARCSGIDQDAAGVLVRCVDGRTFEGAAAVAADGISSTVRQQLLNDGPAQSTGYVAYRGTVPADDVKEATGTEELTDMVIWIGPAMHLVQYPLRGGSICNQVAVFRSDAFKPESEDWGSPTELIARFQIASSPVQRSVELIDKARRWEMYDRAPRRGWVHGRIALLGDAAHPMLQYLAQGACQALEDAHVLGKCIDSHSDVKAALKDYENRRFPRTSAVQTRARTFGEVLHADGAFGQMRNYLLRRRGDLDFEPVDWLYVASAENT